MASKLANMRILVVEDEYYIASDLARACQRAEAEVVGPFGDLASALKAAEQEPIDAAILDVNLEGALIYPIAERLTEREIPFVFLTGYDDWALEARWQAAARIAKPFQMDNVLDVVADMISGKSG